MLFETDLETNTSDNACSDLVSAWSSPDLKVFLVKAGEKKIDDVRDYYERLFPLIGTPVNLAEDVKLGGRDDQRSGDVWMEVRYDPKYPDAYRHSCNAQPLHTDGSYIPDFPNATLLCCVSNVSRGGETIFIDANNLVSLLESDNPELLEFLVTENVVHERSGDKRKSPIIYRKNSLWHVNFNYYCVSKNTPHHQKKKIEEFFSYLQNSRSIKKHLVEIKLEPGDAVLWKDDQVLHGRHTFSAQRASERFIWKCCINVGVLPGAS